MPPTDDERMRLRALARWEGEGGALGRSGTRTDTLDESELRILARIGYAALGAWNALPHDAKEAMLADVCRPLVAGDGARARERIAAFLRSYETERVAGAKRTAPARKAGNASGTQAEGASSAPPGPRPKITGPLTPALGRGRLRLPESARRAPLPATVARPTKRTGQSAVPAFIRDAGSKLDSADRDYIRRKLGMKLGKFGDVVERVSVRVKDMNGPRGGVDKSCRIKVVLSGLPSVVVEQQDASLQAAVDRALGRTERAVRQSVQRRRTRAR
jgi:ribosome-associated translation inhibitor RaiA